jgi:2-amino-4-hydroxy-6-hydroxymethyldihydropteridine diphosphokinase
MAHSPSLGHQGAETTASVMKITTKSSPKVRPSTESSIVLARARRHMSCTPFQEYVVGLGANLGDRRAWLEAGARAVADLGRVLAVSSLYDTHPVGPPQPRYLNAALRFRSALTPDELLQAVLAAEQRLGRVREQRWAPRIIDLDILWGPGLVVATPRLVVPHPELHKRAFALVPLLDVAPEAADPRTLQPYRDCLSRLPDELPQRIGGDEWGRDLVQVRQARE